MPLDGVPQNPVVTRLEQAGDYLIQHGWCQGRLQDEAGHVCINGALLLSGGHDATWWGVSKYDPIQRANTALCGMLGTDPTGLVNWNNAPKRTEEEVLDLIAKTIAHLVTA